MNGSLKFSFKTFCPLSQIHHKKTNNDNCFQIYNTQDNRWREYLDSFHETKEDQRKRRKTIWISNAQITNEQIASPKFQDGKQFGSQTRKSQMNKLPAQNFTWISGSSTAPKISRP
jgi:hypothetical protein